jgi:hypothetical protein
MCFGEKTALTTNGAGKTEYLLVEEWNQIPISHPVQNPIQNERKILMWDVKLCNNWRKTEKTLEDIGIGNAVRPPIAQEIRAIIGKWYCIKLKSCWTSKEAVIRIKDNLQNTSYLLKDLISRIYKELTKLTLKE